MKLLFHSYRERRTAAWALNAGEVEDQTTLPLKSLIDRERRAGQGSEQIPALVREAGKDLFVPNVTCTNSPGLIWVGHRRETMELSRVSGEQKHISTAPKTKQLGAGPGSASAAEEV